MTSGMSRAARIPKERMVRSTGYAGVVDRDALAPDHPEGLVHGAERVRAQGHRVEDLARPHLDVDPSPLALAQPQGDAGAAGAGEAHVDGPRPGRGRGRARRVDDGEHLGPAGAAQLGRHRRARDGHLLDLDARAQRPHPRHQRTEPGRAGRAPDAHDTGAVRPQREGDGRALGAEADHVLA